MKIKIICDRDNELLGVKSSLKKELQKRKYNQDYKIKIVPKSCENVDIYLILSNDLEFIYKNSYDFKVKGKTDENLIVLTSNLKSANIVGCLDITPYVYYVKTKIEAIVFKIIKVYNRNVIKNINIPNNLYEIPVKSKKDS